MTSTDRRLGVTGSAAFKVPCRVATTANITLSGLQTIDGVTLVADDRVLVKNQTTGSENGIYVADTSAWERAVDFDGSRDCAQGTLVLVVAGTVNASTVFQLTTASPVIGTSSLTFAVTGTPALTYATAFIQTLLDDTTAAAARTTLGVPSTTEAILEALLTTRGDMVRRGATAAERVALGAVGKLWGAGATDPSWLGLSIVAQVFSGASGSPYTYTPTPGMIAGIAIGVGGGGGGGAIAGDVGWASAAAGGGAGAPTIKAFTAADIGASKSVTIGAKGAGGAAGNNNGADATDTSLGALLVAKGGKGGQYTNAGTQVGVGGLGGIAGTGSFTPTGTPGGSGQVITSAAMTGRGADGGSSLFGGAGRGGLAIAAGATAGGAATNYGAGGGGGSALDSAATAAGGDGSDGVLLILELVLA